MNRAKRVTGFIDGLSASFPESISTSYLSGYSEGFKRRLLLKLNNLKRLAK